MTDNVIIVLVLFSYVAHFHVSQGMCVAKNSSGITPEKVSCHKHLELENSEGTPEGPCDQIVLKNITDERLQCCLRDLNRTIFDDTRAIFIEDGGSFTLPTLTDQLSNVTSEVLTQSLHILTTELTLIPRHGFSIFRNIRWIILVNNSMTNLYEESFYNLTTLFEITITQNYIKCIPRHTFSSLPLLRLIRLNGNKILTIEEEAFYNLPRVTKIDLSDNLLHTLDQSSFKMTPKLRTLSLVHNGLTTLTSEFVTFFPKVKFVVEDNPWHCNCSLKWLIELVSETAPDEETMCDIPKNTTMQMLTGSELPCAQLISPRSRSHVHIVLPVLFGSLAILCVVLGGLCIRKRAKTSKKTVNNRQLSVVQQPPCNMTNNTNYNRLFSNSSSFSSEIPFNNNSILKVGKLLGSGAFGEVFEGYSGDVDNGNRKVAIKMIKENSAAQDLTALDQEFKQLTQIDAHPNIIQVFSTGKIDGSYVMVMEMAEHGDLLTYLRNIYHKEELIINSMDQSEERFYLPRRHPGLFELILNVAKGMEYLAHLKIVHRDLAARNILICEGPVAKIADFGLSRDVYESGYYYQDAQGRLPYKWLSPETLLNGKTTLKSDVWSFGVLIWEVVTLGSNPYPGIPPSMLMDMYRNKYVMPQPSLCPNDVYDIMKRCWDHSIDTRPTFCLVAEMLELYILMVIPKTEHVDIDEDINETLELMAGVD